MAKKKAEAKKSQQVEVKLGNIKKQKSPSTSIPKDEREVDASILAISDAKRAMDKLEADAEAEIAKIKAKLAVDLAPHREKLTAAFYGIYLYCKQNRAVICKSGVKYWQLLQGLIKWYFGGFAAVIEDEEGFIKMLLRRRLKRYLRFPKPEVNREDLIRDRDEKAVQDLPGLQFSQTEWFAVVPTEIVEHRTDCTGDEPLKRVA